MLYIKSGGVPTTLPAMDVDSAGSVWSDLENSAEGRAACGWTLAPEKPVFDPATQVVEWVDGEWAVVDLPPPPAPEPRKVHAVIFKQRFTATERKAIRAAAKVDEDVEDWLDLVNTATEVYLDLPETVAALGALETAGLLAAGRAAEILA